MTSIIGVMQVHPVNKTERWEGQVYNPLAEFSHIAALATTETGRRTLGSQLTSKSQDSDGRKTMADSSHVCVKKLTGEQSQCLQTAYRRICSLVWPVYISHGSKDPSGRNGGSSTSLIVYVTGTWVTEWYWGQGTSGKTLICWPGKAGVRAKLERGQHLASIF